MFDIIFPISNNSEIKLGIPISRLKLNLEFEVDTSTNKEVGAAKDHGEKTTFFNSPPFFAWESIGRFKSRNLTNLENIVSFIVKFFPYYKGFHCGK